MNGLAIYRGREPQGMLRRVVDIQRAMGHGATGIVAGEVLVCRLHLAAEDGGRASLHHDEETGVLAVVAGYFRESQSGEVPAHLAERYPRFR